MQWSSLKYIEAEAEGFQYPNRRKMYKKKNERRFTRGKRNENGYHESRKRRKKQMMRKIPETMNQIGSTTKYRITTRREVKLGHLVTSLLLVL